MTMRIAVCDDDKACRENIVALIEEWSNHQNIPIQIDDFTNGDSLIHKNALLHFDIIFLDIIMPLFNGMDTAKELRTQDRAAKIIFLTSSPEFALASYEVKAQSYIIKPITYQKTKEVLDDCYESLYKEPKNIIVKTSSGYQKIFLHNIEYAEAQNKKVIVYLRNNSVIEVLEPLYLLEEKLTSSDGFFKCHRSYLIYLPNVNHFNQASAVTKTGRTVPIARGYGKTFQEAYFTAMFHD